MDTNTETKSLREEITRLKIRLSELDNATEPTSVACGHDIVLDHLRKLTKQHELSGLSQLAGLDEKHGWYTTNVEPSKIRTLLENGDTLREFLSVFCEKGVWEALESAYHGELITEGAEAIGFLEKKQLLMDNKLTSKGFTCYVVLGHLAFNTAKKLDIRKAIEISKLVYDSTGIHYGEHLPYSAAEFAEILSKHPDYANLANYNVSLEDIGEYLRQNNA